MTRIELRVFLDSFFCGCGMPNAACGALLRFLSLHERSDDSWERQRKERDQWIPDDGLQMLVLYLIDSLGLLEHGGSVGGSWLTDKGAAVLARLREEQADDFEALLADHCVHGYGVEDDIANGTHDCAAFEKTNGH